MCGSGDRFYTAAEVFLRAKSVVRAGYQMPNTLIGPVVDWIEQCEARIKEAAMQRKMRAKMRVMAITPAPDGSSERLVLTGVSRNGPYPSDGSDEDNSYAKFSPAADLNILIANPALVGSFTVGDTFYVDFIPIPRE